MSFGGFLHANTQTVVVVGPFVDVTDGFTPETGITLSGADEAELLKHNSSTVVDISGATWAAITSCDGYYALTLTTSHLDTEGLITVVVQDDSVCLPVKMTWQVIAQAAWASLITAKDTGYMDVNVKAVSEDTTAADNLELACDNYSTTRGLAGTALPAAAANAAGGLIISSAGGLAADTLASNVAAILADTGTDGVVVAAASKTGYSLTATTGLGNQTANITGNLSGSVGSVTAGVTLADDAITAAKFDESTAFPLKSADTGATAVARTGGDSDTLETLSDQLDGIGAAAIADAVWDEALSGHSGAGSAGATLAAAGSAGDPWSTAIPGAYGSGTAGNILGNRLVGTIATGTHNPQSGDSYARLGAPAGASISADVAAVKSQTAAIETDTQDLQTQIGTAGAGLTALPTVDANIVAVNDITIDGAGTAGDPWGPAT